MIFVVIEIGNGIFTPDAVLTGQFLGDILSKVREDHNQTSLTLEGNRCVDDCNVINALLANVHYTFNFSGKGIYIFSKK